MIDKLRSNAMEKIQEDNKIALAFILKRINAYSLCGFWDATIYFSEIDAEGIIYQKTAYQGLALSDN